MGNNIRRSPRYEQSLVIIQNAELFQNPHRHFPPSSSFTQTPFLCLYLSRIYVSLPHSLYLYHFYCPTKQLCFCVIFLISLFLFPNSSSPTSVKRRLHFVLSLLSTIRISISHCLTFFGSVQVLFFLVKSKFPFFSLYIIFLSCTFSRVPHFSLISSISLSLCWSFPIFI